MNINLRLLKLLNNKSVLFIEDDFTLSNSVGEFHEWCINNKVEYNCLFRCSELPIDYIINQVEYFDIVAFETQWVNQAPFLIKEAISKMKSKKTIIECYTYQATWKRKPKVVHDVYILECPEGEEFSSWSLEKLK